MKRNQITIVGRVDNQGQLMIGNKAEMNQFFSTWPNGRVVMEVSILDNKPSRLLQGYYFKKVVPDFQNIFKDHQGERLTLQQTDLKLREQSPSMLEELPYEETGGFDIVRVKTAYDCTSKELIEHVKYSQELAAKQYGTFIADPSSNY